MNLIKAAAGYKSCGGFALWIKIRSRSKIKVTVLELFQAVFHNGSSVWETDGAPVLYGCEIKRLGEALQKTAKSNWKCKFNFCTTPKSY
jgi:hypothetical protein